jgi:hypothetical protein
VRTAGSVESGMRITSSTSATENPPCSPELLCSECRAVPCRGRGSAVQCRGRPLRDAAADCRPLRILRAIVA